MRFARLVLCAAAATAAPAADALGVSLRVGAEQSDDAYAIRTIVGGVAVDGDGRWNDADRFVAEALYSRSFLLAGLGLEYTAANDRRGATHVEYQVLAGRAEAGATVPIGRWLHLELVLFAALGPARLETDSTTTAESVGHDTYVEYGADANLVFRIDRLLEIGVGAGWHRTEAEFDNRIAGVEVTSRIREERAFGRIFMGAHF